ncbi:uncharacterized protein LOC115214083, partial [Argonauta hians]
QKLIYLAREIKLIYYVYLCQIIIVSIASGSIYELRLGANYFRMPQFRRIVEVEETVSDISGGSAQSLNISSTSGTKSKKKKRHKFSTAEDIRMLKYIMEENRYNELKGIALWKDMQMLEITTHTSQSMKFRFLKTVVPNLHKYNINKDWIKILSQHHPDLFPTLNSDRSPCPPKVRHALIPSMFSKQQKNPSPSPSKSPRELRPRQPRKEQDETTEDEGEEETGKEKEESSESETVSYKMRSDEIDIETEEEGSTWEQVSKKKKNKKLRVARTPSSSESEMEGAASKYQQQKKTDTHSNESSESSDYDKEILNIAKNVSNSVDDVSDESSGEELPIEGFSDAEDRRQQLMKKRQSQKAENCASQPKPSEEVSPDNSLTIDQRVAMLTNFIIGETPNKPKPQGAPNVDGSDSEEDHPVRTRPLKKKDLDRMNRIIDNMCKDFKLEYKQVVALLMSTNGNVQYAVLYIKYGRLSGVSPWTEKEDDIIFSTDAKKLDEILQKRGHIAVAERLRFLESF